MSGSELKRYCCSLTGSDNRHLQDRVKDVVKAQRVALGISVLFLLRQWRPIDELVTHLADLP